MNTSRPYNFRATLAAYILTGIVVALVIHVIVLSSPKYNWIYPVTSSSAPTVVNPAPGAK
jgi:hypothetical protein